MAVRDDVPITSGRGRVALFSNRELCANVAGGEQNHSLGRVRFNAGGECAIHPERPHQIVGPLHGHPGLGQPGRRHPNGSVQPEQHHDSDLGVLLLVVGVVPGRGQAGPHGSNRALCCCVTSVVDF